MTEKRHPAAVEVGGEAYLRDAKGNLVPIATIKASDLLIDEAVRIIVARAREQSEMVKRFKADTFDEVASLLGLIAQDYGTTMGGKKGNLTLHTYDGCEKVQVQVADLFEFGPELQVAKVLIDECLTEWSAGSAVELRAIVNRAFSVEKEGQINRAELFLLLRAEIADERWQRAMQAIRDSMRVIGSRQYMRFYERDEADGPWRGVTIDMASA